MTIKPLLPSPRYTAHDATESVLRNIRNLLQQTILMGVFEIHWGMDVCLLYVLCVVK
jgi:hypothetical protein